MGGITIKVNPSDPDTPSEGWVRLFPRADGSVHVKDDTGDVRQIDGGSGGGDVTSPGGETSGRLAIFSGSKAIAQASALTESAVSTHVGSTSNPHSVSAAQVGADPSGTAASAISTHEGAGDPHSGYQLRSEKNQASGYAGLDGSTKLAGAQQAYGSSANTACEGNDARLSDPRTPTGSAGGDLGGTYPNPTVNDGADSTAVHVDVAGEIAGITEKGSPASGDWLLLESVADSNAKRKVQIGNLPGGGGGEANDLVNAGTGASLVASPSKVGVNLQIRGVASTTDRIGVAVDAGDENVELTLNEGNVVHQNLSGAGTNTHAQIDAHIASTANPHSVTAVQAGADPAGTAASAVSTHEGETDPHTVYSLADGTRAFSGTVSGVTPTAGGHLATKDYVDSVSQGIEWQDSVFDRDLSAPPGGPTAGDRYIVASGGSGDWSGHDDEIADWNGSSWDFTTPTEGMTVAVDDESRNLRWNGSAWVFFGTTVDHGNLAGLGDDDHPQYQLESEKDSAGGYAGLDGSSKLAGTQQVYGASANTACEGNDARLSDSRTDDDAVHVDVAGEIAAVALKETPATGDLVLLESVADSNAKRRATLASFTDPPGTAAAAVSTHAGLSDPHPGYQLETEKNSAGGYAGLDGSSKLTGAQQVYGSSANTACEGNDARLSDSRTDDDAVHVNVDAEIAAITEKVSPAGGDWLLIESAADSNAKRRVQVGNLPTGGGGEANDLVNAGTGVSGVASPSKSGVNLQLRGFASANDRLSVAADGANENVELTLTEANIVHQNLSGAGTLTHAQIDAQAPTSDEKAALAGTSGSPADGNRYVTDADSRLTDARAPTAHAASHGAGQSDEVQVESLGTAATQPSLNLRPDGSGGLEFTSPTGGGARLVDVDVFDGASQTMADPGSGTFRLNNATLASATAMAISATTTSSSDWSTLLARAKVGDSIYIQQEGDVARWHVFAVTGAATDNGTWLQIPVSQSSAGTAIEDAERCNLAVLVSDSAEVTANKGQASGYASLDSNTAVVEAVQVVRTTDGPTSLSVGSVTDGQLVVRSASNLVGVDTAGVDSSAIHGGVAGEIAAVALKETPDTGDLVLLESVADSNAKRRATLSSFTDPPGTAASAVSTHEGAGDPHPGYQQESEKNSAGGYAGLDGSSKLTGAQQTYGTIADTACEGNDSRLSDSRTPTGSAGGDLGGTYPNPTVNDGADATAIHDDTAGEISAVTEKVSPVGADLVLIEDSENANAKRRVQLSNLPAGSVTDNDAIHDDESGEIAAITEKTTPVSADLLLIEDSEASNVKKRVQIGNLPGGSGGGSPFVQTVVTVPHAVRSIASAAIPLENDGEVHEIEVTFGTDTDGSSGSFVFVFKVGDPTGSSTTIGTVTVTQGTHTASTTPGSPVAYSAGDALFVEQTAIGAFAESVPNVLRRAACVARYTET